MHDNASSTSGEIVGIKNLEAEFDVELAKELAQAWLDDTTGIVTGLQMAFTQKDQETLRSKAHMLKGCSRAIQAFKVEKASGMLESHARDGNWDGVNDTIDFVVEAYVETEQFLRHYLA